MEQIMSDKFETIKTRGGHMTLNVTRLKDYQEDKAKKKDAADLKKFRQLAINHAIKTIDW
jgi:hypothetical protein